jgi:hypothetical protein
MLFKNPLGLFRNIISCSRANPGDLEKEPVLYVGTLCKAADYIRHKKKVSIEIDITKFPLSA